MGSNPAKGASFILDIRFYFGYYNIVQTRLLRWPNKSHRKSILIPKESMELAELMGVVFGDGGIDSNWQVVISLNAISDLAYASFLCDLFMKLFGIDVVFRKRKGENCLLIVCSSSNVVDFLVSKGAIRGNKIVGGLDIPEWIMENRDYSIACLRGIMDTDGCTYIDHHNYKEKTYGHIGISIASKSEYLLRSMYLILKGLGYSPTLTTKWRIILRKEKEVLRFFEEIKPSNSRHYKVFNKFLEEYRSGHNGTVSKAVIRVTET